MSFGNLHNSICRTCLTETGESLQMSVQDLVEYDSINVKLIDILVFLNCVENNDDENWPKGICSTCVSTVLIAYSFKHKCLKANAALSEYFVKSETSNYIEQPNLDSIDINVIYQDHEYDVPLFGNSDFELETKELTPLPPVTEITSTEQLPRKEGDKKFACSICSRSFTRIYGLRYHMARHGEPKQLCPKCGKRFHTLNGLKQHLISHKSQGQFKCGFCNKIYKSRQSLKEHFRVAHSSNRQSFVCVTCGKCFTAKQSLLAHIKIHNGDKQYSCPHCPKKYTRALYLKMHRLVHTGQERPKPFVCDYENCDRSFSTKHCLSVHIAHIHNSQRPHKCDICSKGFATSAGLKIHRESHGTKELTCQVCGKKLANRRVLRKHIKGHNVHTDDMILGTVVNNLPFLDHLYNLPIDY